MMLVLLFMIIFIWDLLITIKIFQIYKIELKGNYKDENIDNEKIKLVIKYEKKIKMYITLISKK